MIKFCHEEGIKDCLEISFKLCFQRKVSLPKLKVPSTAYKVFLPTVLVLYGIDGSYT